MFRYQKIKYIKNAFENDDDDKKSNYNDDNGNNEDKKRATSKTATANIINTRAFSLFSSLGTFVALQC